MGTASSGPGPGPGFGRLAREPSYLRFLSTATAARVADEMFSVGVVLLVLERTGSAALAGVLVAAITFPSLVTAPLLGAWLDLRGRRKALMMVDQAIATAVLVCIALMAGRAPDLLVVGIVLLAGLTWPLSFGGFTSLIPVLVPDELLPPANAIEATSLNAALIVGPLLAGAIAAVAGPEASVLTEAALTFAALLLLVGFDKLDSGPVRTGGSLLGVARDGLRALVRAPPLLATTVAGSINLMGAGLLTVAFPLFCVEELGANRNASGVLWAAFAVGSTVGALAFVGVARRHAPERVLLVSLVVFGLLMLSWPLASSLPVAIVLVAVAAVAEGPGLSATFAVRQNWAPRDLQGQIFTTAAGVKVGAFALGAAVAGPLVTSVGSADTLLISAATNFVAAAAGVWVIRRGRGRGRGRDPGRAQAGPPR